MARLKCETNTSAIERRVCVAFGRWRYNNTGKRWAGKIDAFFEHGQWWITHLPTCAQWSVCDAEGGDAVDGFTFEQVTDGDDQE